MRRGELSNTIILSPACWCILILSPEYPKVRPMSATKPRLSREELARRGDDIYRQQVRLALRPEDDGKFVALDVESGNFEVDEDEFAAVARLHDRLPGAQVWLMRAGYPATHRLRSGR